MELKKIFIGLKAFLFMFVFILLWGWIGTYFTRFDSLFGISLPEWIRFAGVLLMSIGGIITVLCVAFFVMKGSGTPAPFDAPVEFVRAGPYKYVRNPMFIAGFLVFIGYGLFKKSISIFLFSFIWLALAHLLVIYYEEPTLKNKFGLKYKEYCKSVNRWLPW